MITNIIQRFPGIPVLPVYGNNDMLKNYQIPGEKDVKTVSFFNTTRDIWFKDPGLKNIVAPTFSSGGWYEYEVNDEFSVLGLNTILFNYNLGP